MNLTVVVIYANFLSTKSTYTTSAFALILTTWMLSIAIDVAFVHFYGHQNIISSIIIFMGKYFPPQKKIRWWCNESWKRKKTQGSQPNHSVFQIVDIFFWLIFIMKVLFFLCASSAEFVKRTGPICSNFPSWHDDGKFSCNKCKCFKCKCRGSASLDGKYTHNNFFYFNLNIYFRSNAC